MTTAAVISIVLCATLVRATFGFGDALISMPLLSLLIDVRLAAPLVALVSATTSVLIIEREWRNVELSAVRPLVLAAVVGVPIGVLYLKGADEGVVKGLLSAIVICFSLYGLFASGSFSLTSDRWAWVFGFCAGVLGGAYNTYGPPLAIYGTLRKWQPSQFRANIQSCFLAAGVVVLCSHAYSGLWVASVLRNYIAALPVVIIANLVGRRVAGRVQAGKFVKYIYGLLILVGCMLAYQALGV